ncbi:MAG: potassium transporter Kef [Actinobacteria bacterium]|nr:MAG: potassium transporter Kef [Actinomycetota bacterium]
MELALVVVAFGFGIAASRARLPALVGYLAAGFVLHALGFETTEAIENMSELGVYLLLFGIGLKLKVGFLARPEVWGTATIGVAATAAIAAGVMLALGVVGLPMAASLDVGQAALVGFAFSFSSTVFAVKILEEMNESGSLSGRIAVGVLIVQDLFAVAFLTFAAGEQPSIWALPMILLLLTMRPVFGWLVSLSGHGELFVLLGFTLAVGIGAGGFGLVGLKPELGALAAGIVVSSHPRAGEMTDRLLDFKDLFLIGFFLSIGLAGTPPLGSYVVVVSMLVLMPVRSALFFVLFTRFRLRTRTALHSSLTLSTYSEFGLIVAAASQANGYLDQAWVSAIAVAVASSFVLAAAANTSRYRLYGALSNRMARLERLPRLPDDAIADSGRARVVVFGMGRVGAGAYDTITARRGMVAVGVDRSAEVIAMHESLGRIVVRGDALDRDFWERLRLRNDLELIVLAMDNHPSNLLCVERAREFLPGVRIAAIARYPDQVLELRDSGVDVARNLYEEAGQGLAEDAVTAIWNQPFKPKDSHCSDQEEELDESQETSDGP